MSGKKKYFLIISVAILLKIFLFVGGTLRVPQSKFAPDTASYMNAARGLKSAGTFASVDDDGILRYETFRTPGYPLFIVFFHHLIKIPLSGIVFIQLLLTVFTAFVVYKIAWQIDKKIAFLSSVIFLYDMPVTVSSMRLLTETLYLSVFSIFIFTFIVYLKKLTLKWLLFSAISLVAATYIRPVSYYLGVAVFFYLIYVNREAGIKKSLTSAFLFFIVVYSLLVLWQLRNYVCCDVKDFSSVASYNFNEYSLIKFYKAEGSSFYSCYIKPIFSCAATFMSSLLNFMTSPGTLKYFSLGGIASFFKGLAYIWMGLWLIGFVTGAARMKDNRYYQFLVLVIFYFSLVTVINISTIANDRFRVPVVSCVSVIAAFGWMYLRVFFMNLFNRNNK